MDSRRRRLSKNSIRFSLWLLNLNIQGVPPPSSIYFCCCRAGQPLFLPRVATIVHWSPPAFLLRPVVVSLSSRLELIMTTRWMKWRPALKRKSVVRQRSVFIHISAPRRTVCCVSVTELKNDPHGLLLLRLGRQHRHRASSSSPSSFMESWCE